MCGRFGFSQTDSTKLKKRFSLKDESFQIEPRYNIAPSQNVSAILNISPDEISPVHWGLVPSWSKEKTIKYSMINARAETIDQKPSYKKLIKRQRCLILADLFYEWKKAEDGKQPYCIRMKDEEVFAFAGLWDHWRKDGEELTSCTIITTQPNELMKNIHDRMPVILQRENEERWLSDISQDEALDLLNPFNNDSLKAYPISKAVNSPSHDGPEIIEKV